MAILASYRWASPEQVRHATGRGEEEELESFKEHCHPDALLRFLRMSHHVGSLGEFQMLVLGECSHSEWKDGAASGGKLAELSVCDSLA